MKRWWLIGFLLLSLGVNLGLVLQGLLSRRTATVEPPPVEATDNDSEVDIPRPDGGPQTEGPRIDLDPTWRPQRDTPQILVRMADDLDLEGEDRDQFLAIHHRFLARTLRGRRALGELQNQMRLLLIADEPDHEQIDRLLQQSARTHYELERVFVETLLAGRELLEDEREMRYLQMLSRWRRGREARRMMERWRAAPGPQRRPEVAPVRPQPPGID